MNPVITSLIPFLKAFEILLSDLEVINGVSAKHISTIPSKSLSKDVAVFTASPVPKGCFWIMVVIFWFRIFNLSNYSETTIIDFFIPADLLASITHCIMVLPEIKCSGLGMFDNILVPFPALNIIEQTSIKMLYLLSL